MEELIGPKVEIVLTIKEVTDLTFINVPVVVTATLLENQMETDKCEPDANVKFNVDLIWETNKTNIKKMRNNNVPIKINLIKCFKENQREKFGYVVVNLRSAQYIPRGKVVKINENNIKILGLGKEAKGYSPHILLSLRIQDKNLDDLNEVPQKNSVANKASAEKLDIDNVAFNKEGSHELALQEGFPLEHEADHGTVKLPSPQRSPRMKHSLMSNLQEKKASLSSYERRNSSGDLQPQKKYIQAFHSYKLKVKLKNIIWYQVPPKFNFRFHQTRSEVVFTAHPEVVIEKANEEVELCDIEATFVFIETPSEFFKLLATVPPIVSIFWNAQNRPVVIARGVLESEKLICNGDETIHNIDFIDIKSYEVLGKLCYSATLTDCGPQVLKDVTLKLNSASTIDESDVPPVFAETVTDKIVDELEEWKERQKDIFQQKFTAKLKTEIQELRSEWMDRKRDLEEQLIEKMEQCRQLGNSLLTATEDVKQKNKEILEKEKALEATENELESRYLKLLQEKNEESERLTMEINKAEKNREIAESRLEEERNEMGSRIKELQEENEKLKQALKTAETELEKNKRACLSQEQTATLLQDLKTMQEKLETANNSKLFFKEQWGRAVREIHRIKSEYTKNIQVQLQYRKDELKRLGLEQLYLSEKNKGKLESDDTILEGKEFLGSDFDVKSNISDIDFPYKLKSNYETFKSSMDLVRESNTYLLKNNQELEERLKKLIEERDKLLCEELCQIDDEKVVKLNKEIRHLLEY